MKKERYAFDDEDLRPYFPIQSVLQGMFELVSKVFGLRIEERPTQFGEKFSGEKLESFPVQSGMKKLGSTIYLIIKMIDFLVPSTLTGIPDQANERVHG